MSVLLALLLGLVGLVYAAPGLLPAAADPATRVGRIVSGFGLIVVAVGVGYFGVEPVTGGGMALVSTGLGVFAVAIMRQPCEPEK